MFYAGYQLAVTRLRSRASTASIMAWSGLVTAAALLPIALLSGEQILPATAMGWVKLFGLALISQAAGQSLIAYAMAHLPATFSSVGLLLQPVMAALFAWVLLGEALGWVAIAGRRRGAGRYCHRPPGGSPPGGQGVTRCGDG